LNAKRIVFPQQYHAALEEFQLDETTLGEHELLVKTRYSVISAGTEGASFTGLEREHPGAASFSYPRYPGYGNVGEVLAVGRACEGYRVGDIVFSTAPHASHAKVDVRRVCLGVPVGLEPLKAVFGRMAAVAVTAVRKADLALGDTVLVIGMGLVGNFAAQEFRLAGADVMAADVSGFRLERAERCGITRTVNPQRTDMRRAVLEWTGGRGAQITVEAVGQPELIAQAVDLTRRSGDIILLGSPRKRVTMDVTPMLSRVHLQGITVKGALEWLYQIQESEFLRHTIIGNMRQIFSWLQSGSLKTEPLLTHLLPPEKCQEAYEGLDRRRDEYLGVVFDWRQ